MKKSVEFEKLVAKIVGELEPAAAVTWNDHIIGKLSGRRRQVDVSIRRQDPAFLGIIDAKDYTRPATIERIDTLTGVMRDVEAHYGALVCSSGFSKSIYEYARNCGISLFNVHDAQSLNWSLELKVPIVWTELTPITQIVGKFYFEAGDQVAADDPRGAQVTTDGGITLVDPIATFEKKWNEGSLPQTPGVEHRVSSNLPVEALVFDAANDRQLRPVFDYGIVYVVQARSWLGKFQPAECRGLVDYLDSQAFYATFLPDSAVPFQRDDKWEAVEDPAQLAITARGTVAICTAPVFVSNGKIYDLSLNYLGPTMPGPSLADPTEK